MYACAACFFFLSMSSSFLRFNTMTAYLFALQFLPLILFAVQLHTHPRCGVSVCIHFVNLIIIIEWFSHPKHLDGENKKINRKFIHAQIVCNLVCIVCWRGTLEHFWKRHWVEWDESKKKTTEKWKLWHSLKWKDLHSDIFSFSTHTHGIRTLSHELNST